ncbi:Protein of unknown function [Pyronema omphalodes CBS 100304]|uniref:Uncharacterized protein n=1 Tax=Pyronema omphalodes (strain CBS 100304) TaxID=1076935 RepID=U4LDR9_PYROM|nr:Protein of unknown function [Pyronema omphalodes CBS 100304]
MTITSLAECVTSRLACRARSCRVEFRELIHGSSFLQPLTAVRVSTLLSLTRAWPHPSDSSRATSPNTEPLVVFNHAHCRPRHEAYQKPAMKRE